MPATTPVTTGTLREAQPTDAATGLRQAARRTSPPAGAVVDPIADQASLFIEAGSQSYSGSGGSCSVFDGYTYVLVGAPGAQTATLSWNTAVPTEGQFLTWQYGGSTDTALISTHGVDADDGIRITFGPAGTSGSFTGWYYLVESETFWEFEGSFSCLPAPLSILGEHPVSLIDARCTTDGISAGGSGSADAALLSVDLDAPEVDGQREGALTWRVGGVVYATDWLLIRLTVDGLGASFSGRAVGPDGFPFDVKGSFNCLNG